MMNFYIYIVVIDRGSTSEAIIAVNTLNSLFEGIFFVLTLDEVFYWNEMELRFHSSMKVNWNNLCYIEIYFYKSIHVHHDTYAWTINQNLM